jgi:hypothetical protein
MQETRKEEEEEEKNVHRQIGFSCSNSRMYFSLSLAFNFGATVL